MTDSPSTLAAMAADVLQTADGREKTAKSRAHAKAWLDARAAGHTVAIGQVSPPDHPSRPKQPELLNRLGQNIYSCWG